MPRRRPRSVRLAFFAAMLVAFFVMSHGDQRPTQAQAVPPYSVLGFGALGGASSAFSDIHDLGTFMVGQVQTSNGATRAALVRSGVLEDLGTLGGPSSVVWAANWGAIAGQAQTASLETHAFRVDYRTAGALTMTDLGTLGGTWSAAYGTDDQSIVGASTLAGSSRLHAFLYTNGGMSPLPVDAGGDSVARDVLFEQAVGYACTAANASCRAFWVKEGVSTTLPSLGGNAAANAINAWERIVGVSATSNPATKHAFLFADGVLTDLGTLGGPNSEALDINGDGDVVGTSDSAASGPRAFLWRNGIMTDLNTVIPAGSGWILQQATAISEGGQIVGAGTLNGQTRGFLLTPPFDLSVWQHGQRSQTTSNLPNGVEAGGNIRLIDSVVGAPDPLTIYGARFTATLTGPAEYVSVASYDSQPGHAPECQLTATTITCDLLPIDTVFFGPEYKIVVRTTGSGAIRHRATVTLGAPDTNPSNDTLTENNRAVALSALTLTPASVAGGKAASVRVTLTDQPPGGDAVLRLSSSRPDIAPVPATFIAPNHGGPSREFNLTPAVVSQPTPVEITATYGLVTITKTLTVLPPALAQLYLTPTTIVGGCGTSAGKIMLTGAAPAGGAVVPLTNTNSKATVPATVTVPAGASSHTFTVPTSFVTANQAGSVTASYGGVSQTLTVTVRPIRVSTLALSPNPATGGSNVSASVALECAAPAGGVVVNLSSSNASAAAPTVSSITIPAGATTRSFTVRTSPVTASSSVNIYATVYGVRKTAALTVRP